MSMLRTEGNKSMSKLFLSFGIIGILMTPASYAQGLEDSKAAKTMTEDLSEQKPSQEYKGLFETIASNNYVDLSIMSRLASAVNNEILLDESTKAVLMNNIHKDIISARSKSLTAYLEEVVRNINHFQVNQDSVNTEVMHFIKQMLASSGPYATIAAINIICPEYEPAAVWLKIYSRIKNLEIDNYNQDLNQRAMSLQKATREIR